MLTLKGKLVKVFDREVKIKKGEKAGQVIKTRTLQVLCNGGERVTMFDVTDFEMREWKTGDVEIPVYIKPFVRNNGKAGYSFAIPKGE